MKAIGIGLLSIFGLAGILALAFGLNLFGLAQYSFFAPRIEQVRRNVFEQSQAYNEGMQRDMEEFMLDYMAPTAAPGQKAAICAVARHRIEGYPNVDFLTSDVRSWLSTSCGVQ